MLTEADAERPLVQHAQEALKAPLTYRPNTASSAKSGERLLKDAFNIAALDAQRPLAQEGAELNAPQGSPALVVTVADPLLMLAAQDGLYRAYRAQGYPAGYDETQVQLIAPDPLAYAVGAQDRIDDERTVANVMVGHQGDEVLLMGETGAQRDLLQVGGSDALNAQALLTATADHVVLGEEVFAAGAYLTRRPALIATHHQLNRFHPGPLQSLLHKRI